MIGASPAFLRAQENLKRFARYDAPVLIEGETGTGKELTARAIHYESPRRQGPFVPINCGALPDTLIENELFGHQRGAYTDAHSTSPGLIALATGGTLFLDEVDSLSPKGQVTLLRFMQDQVYRPVGGGSEKQADVRIIAACNQDLEQRCAAHVFRQDLFFRLKLFHLRVPALRERHGDIALLAGHFVRSAAKRYGKAERPFSPGTLQWFESYAWPGNVRELENLVCREFLLCEDALIDIPPPWLAPAAPEPTPGLPPYREAKARAIADFEAAYLTRAMYHADGNVTAAARLTGTERRHLGRLLKKYNIPRPDHA